MSSSALGEAEIAALTKTAREAVEVRTLDNGAQIAFAPREFNLHQLTAPTKPKELPERIQRAASFDNADSLARYVNRYKTASSLLVADIDASVIKVILDYHGRQDGEAITEHEGLRSPQALDHSASWDVGYSEEFKTWDAFNGKFRSQEEAIRFFEENLQDILKPDGASMLELVKDFSSEKVTNFQSSRRLDNGDRHLVYVEQSTNAKMSLPVPTKLTLSLPIYVGEEPTTFEAFFRTRINNGALAIGIEFHRIEAVKIAAFEMAATRVAELTGLDVFYGSNG